MCALRLGYVLQLVNVALLTAVIHAAPQKERVRLPSFIRVCHRNDPLLNMCARNSFNALREHLVAGIPELAIPAIEPLTIPEIKLDQDSGAIYLHSTFRDIVIRGLSNYTLKDIHIDVAKMKLAVAMHVPLLTLDALYEMKGKIMMMPLSGNGACNANFTNVDLDTIINGQRVKRHGRNFIKVKNIKIKYNLGDAKMRLDNLFNGDTALGERMNTFLNENWESLAEEFKPLMENAISEIVRASTDKMFDTYSLDDLLPE